MNIMETLAREKQNLEDFYREEHGLKRNPTPVQKIDGGEDDDSGDIFQGREDDERIISSHE